MQTVATRLDFGFLVVPFTTPDGLAVFELAEASFKSFFLLQVVVGQRRGEKNEVGHEDEVVRVGGGD